MIIAVIMVSLTDLKKPNLLDMSSIQSARTFKGNPFLHFQFGDFKAQIPKSLDPERIAIQCCRKQREDYTKIMRTYFGHKYFS